MGLIVVCIAEAGKRISLTGGPYAYVGVAFGAYADFSPGCCCGCWARSRRQWSDGVRGDRGAADSGGVRPRDGNRDNCLSLGFWSAMNVRGVTLGSRLNPMATVAKLLPLLLIGIGGLFFIRSEHLAWQAAPAAADVARTSRC